MHLLPTDNNWCGRPHKHIFQTTEIELKLLSHNSFPSTALTKRVYNVYYFKFKPPKPLCLGFSWFQLNFCLTVNSRAVAIATDFAYLTPVSLISNSSCGKKSHLTLRGALWLQLRGCLWLWHCVEAKNFYAFLANIKRQQQFTRHYAAPSSVRQREEVNTKWESRRNKKWEGTSERVNKRERDKERERENLSTFAAAVYGSHPRQVPGL